MGAEILVFGMVAALIAGASAYLITLRETRRHFVASERPRREALRSAGVTAACFVVLSGVLAVTLPHMFAGL